MTLCLHFVGGLKLYGAEMCTPNMHVHLHLKQCLLDYGPLAAFGYLDVKELKGSWVQYLTITIL